MRVKPMTLGHAAVTAMSISFSGELAYELHVPNEQLYLTWQLINEAGKNFNLSYFGLYATESMRMEKGYRHWKADLIYERSPFESALDRFVDMTKDDFIGKPALQKELAAGNKKDFVTMTVDCDIAACHAGDSVYSGDQLIGTVTSGGYGHRVSRNIAYAFVDPAHAAEGSQLEIEILGNCCNAVVCEPCLFDKSNTLVRS
jgi:dimethylglycine dehydrogenase